MQISPELGFAILFGTLLALMVWQWFVSRAGSNDRRSLPLFMALMLSNLMILVPRLVWPTAQGLHRVGMLTGTGLVAWLAFSRIRRQKRGDR